MNNTFFGKAEIIIAHNKELEEVADTIRIIVDCQKDIKEFNTLSKKYIINKIQSYRTNNLIVAATNLLITSLIATPQKLVDLSKEELKVELLNEYYNLLLKGLYEVISYHNKINEVTSEEVIKKLINNDISIFNDYKDTCGF